MNVVLQLTEACNLQCTYCYYPDKSPAHMDENTLLQAVDFFAALASERKDPNLNFTFFGGEPLLQSALVYAGDEYIRSRYGKHFRIKNGINTNGTFLDETMAHFLNTRNFRVYYSLDGVQQSHDKQRCFADGKGSWNVVSKNLKMLHPKVVATIRVLTPATMESLVQDSQMFLQMGIKSQIFAPDWNSGWTPASFERLEQLYRELAKWHRDCCEAGQPFYVNILGDKMRLAITGAHCKESSCAVGLSVFAVNPYGDFFPCTRYLSTTDFTWKLGDLQQGFLQEGMDMIATYHAKDREFCDECTIKKRCQGNGCACTAYSTIGGLFGDPSAVVCEHERMICRVVDELYSSANTPVNVGQAYQA